MDNQKLETVAKGIVAPGKGVLAADESFPTIEKRLKSINLESTEEYRRGYRELLFTTGGVEEFIGGVITFDETMRHKSEDGQPFPGRTIATVKEFSYALDKRSVRHR